MIQKYRKVIYMFKLHSKILYYDIISKGHYYDKNTFIKASWETADDAKTIVRANRNKAKRY